ncbi:class I adenylate-forming enzyme family protein [Marinobacter sp.]|uniref:class I adenylate-forming enzyme family protein n=1 Tax=Marinobacter sp. TaxID=50741 RepID=UPI0034A204D2
MKSPMHMPIYAPTDPEETMESIGQRIQYVAAERPHHPALIDGQAQLSWRELVKKANRIANRLRADGLQKGQTVAGLSENSMDYVAVYLGTLVAGGCMVPLSGMASEDSLALMMKDCGAQWVFVSEKNGDLNRGMASQLQSDEVAPVHYIGLHGYCPDDGQNLASWLGNISTGSNPAAVSLDDPFNVIYSSGTTGTPKGILHDYRFRQRQMARMSRFGLDGHAINLVSTPMYSNTTLVSMLPTLFYGGTLVLMAKFSARQFLELAEQHRVTHAMLVPVQYQRILAEPEFDRFDLSAFELKLCTSAPLRAAVIKEAMERWPGNIREVYGLTEGGISTSLDCAAHPDKWDTVGQPTEGADVRVIDDDGNELARGDTGELVGRAISMMRGYINREEQTREMLWTSPEGLVFYRSGDMGKVDDDGFVHILDRRKDMIISGGFNIYAVDLEKVLLDHPSVADAAVIGIPSDQWGETPLGLVVLTPGATASEAIIQDWANAQLGKAQRLALIEQRSELPRSTIGKVLKRELRAPYWA